MRVPEDYIMGTGRKKTKDVGCFGMLVFLAIIVSFFVVTGLWKKVIVPFIVITVLSVLAVIIQVRARYNQQNKYHEELRSTPVTQLSPVQYEEYIALRVKEWGYVNVQMTKSTGDFGADVLCQSSDGKKICIQCKHYSKPVGIKAVQEVLSARSYYNCDAAWVCASNTFTPAAHKLATQTGVKLYTIK